MGAWGAGLFSDDVACDVRDHYRQLIEDGVEDDSVTRQTLETFSEYLTDAGGVALLALAITQSKLGRLDTEIRNRALAALERGADLEVWERDNPRLVSKRRAVLDKVRAQLTGEQPNRQRVRPPKRVSSGLVAGNILAFAVAERVTLLRVVRVHAHRLGETPVLEELDFSGHEVPSRGAVERLGPNVTDPIAPVHPLSPDRRLFAFVMQRTDWQSAGFSKVHTVPTRAGDERAPMPGVGISWTTLAERCRRRAGR